MPEGQSSNVAKVESSVSNAMVFLKDYRPSNYLIKNTDLTFDLQASRTLVTSRLTLTANPAVEKEKATLVLDGDSLQLCSLSLDGRSLVEGEYHLTEKSLSIPNVPDDFELEITTSIEPQKNLALEGLYLSDGMYCTQCEAEGFRRITYYLDRPDIMSVFSTKIIADKEKYPVLLSNGNLQSRGETEDGRHWVLWRDPYKKPCYLFALVAGNLQHIEDSFITSSGREVTLRIFVESKDLDKCDHAMRSLKRAMQWDEEIYGREYDLDLYMIVAVDFFNMGAMENKGLNIFNTSCVLANPKTQTDAEFQRVEGVVAHEYFHNWSGNRVTCRDWFQLSLKEGFTVFRDASFSADMNSSTVKRIEDVSLLRSAQFAEDSGPMSHPVRPDSYLEISNFYTLTIYEKGAELIRMLYQLLGAEKFRRGTDLYFERHDGQAVTCDDFVNALEDASGIDLEQFRLWYSQPGTPVLHVEDHWDVANACYSITIRQSRPSSAGQADKNPLYIPINMALLSSEGIVKGSEQILILNQSEQTWHFNDQQTRPVASLLRGFSAPVKLRFDSTYTDLLTVIKNETDGFSRWDASRHYLLRLIKEHVSGECVLQSDAANKAVRQFTEVLSLLLEQGISGTPSGQQQWDSKHDAAMFTEMLKMPSYAYIFEQFEKINVAAIGESTQLLRQTMAENLQGIFTRLYALLTTQLSGMGEYQPEAEAIALRSLKNCCLDYLMLADDQQATALARDQFAAATNMTEQLAALKALLKSRTVEGEQAATEALDSFYQQWQQESLVVNKWFTVQACSEKPTAFQQLQQLTDHPAYDNTNPNKVRALLGAYCAHNLLQFHAADGKSYDYLADEILRLDQINPQLAARMLAPLTQWRKFDNPQQSKMKKALLRIKSTDKLSSDIYEVVSKTLPE